MIFGLIAGLVSVVVFLWWLASPSSRLKKYGDKIPGPKPYPIFGNALTTAVVGSNSKPDLFDVMKTYGKTFRLWIGPELHVFICEASDIQMVLSSHTLITKGTSYKNLQNWLGTGLLLTAGEFWHKRRKAITPTFHFKILEDFIPVFKRCTDNLINCLSDKTGKNINIVPYLSNATLDAISESAMGIKVDAQVKPKSDYVISIAGMTKCIGERLNYPWRSLEPIYTLSGQKQTENRFLGHLLSLPRQVLADKKKSLESTRREDINAEINEYGMKKRIPFLERLVHIQKEIGVPFEKDQDILDEVTTFMFEGHDTAATCISFTIWALGKFPEIQENVYREVFEIISENPDLRAEDLQEMKYLDRVIKESLRLYPPVTIMGRKIEKDTTFPSGWFAPAGTELHIPIFLVHRHPDYFPEPEIFNPDRFLEELANPYVYMPFSAGPRNCIGKKFAMIEVKTFLSKFVYNYKISTESELKLSRELILRAIGGVKVSLTKR